MIWNQMKENAIKWNVMNEMKWHDMNCNELTCNEIKLNEGYEIQLNEMNEWNEIKRNLNQRCMNWKEMTWTCVWHETDMKWHGMKLIWMNVWMNQWMNEWNDWNAWNEWN